METWLVIARTGCWRMRESSKLFLLFSLNKVIIKKKYSFPFSRCTSLIEVIIRQLRFRGRDIESSWPDKYKWLIMMWIMTLRLFLFLFLLFSFPVTPTAYGNSWARDWIQATAVTYTVAMQMPNPLQHWARDRTHPVAEFWVLNLLHHSGNPSGFFLNAEGRMGMNSINMHRIFVYMRTFLKEICMAFIYQSRTWFQKEEMG